MKEINYIQDLDRIKDTMDISCIMFGKNKFIAMSMNRINVDAIAEHHICARMRHMMEEEYERT